MSIEQYTFCYHPQFPSSLVMLVKPQHMAQLILISLAVIEIILISSQHDQKIIKNNIQSKLNKKVIIKHNVIQIEKDIKQKRIDFHMILICPQSCKIEVENLLANYKQVKHVIFFPAQDQTKTYPIKLPDNFDKDIQYITNINTLQAKLSQCLNDKKYKQKQQKQLCNFIIVDKQVHVSNNLIKSMYAMLNQRIDLKTRQNIVNQFKKFVHELPQDSNIFYNIRAHLQEFVQDIKSQLSTQKALQWYTKDSFVYQVINNILRSSRHPAETFYIQSYFKDLFKAIKSQYELNFEKHEDFDCYRGGRMTKEQILKLQQNIGGIVQNLNFLSTSLDQSIADQFVYNVKFKINVHQKNLNKCQGNGFANIIRYSIIKDQSQILFNPLNSFRLISVQPPKEDQHKKYFTVKLQFLTLATNFEQTKITQQQQAQQSIAKVQREQQSKITCQGDCLIGNHSKGDLQYWLKKYSIIQQNIRLNSSDQKNKYYQDQKSYSAQIIGLIYQERRQLSLALKFYKQSKILKEKLYGYKSEQHASILNSIGTVLKQQGFLQKSLKYLQNSLRIYNLFPSSVDNYALVLNNIGTIWLQKNNLIKALKHLQQSKKIIIRLYGKMHPNYAIRIKNIALVYVKQNKYQQAMSLYRQAKIIQQKMLGKLSTSYIESLYNIGLINFYEKKYQQVIPLIEQGLGIMKQIYGDQHPKCLPYFQDIAIVYKKLGKNKQAQYYQAKYQQIITKIQNQKQQGYIQTIKHIKQSYQRTKQIFKDIKIKARQSTIFQKINIQYQDILKRIDQVFSQLNQLQQIINQFSNYISITWQMKEKIHHLCSRLQTIIHRVKQKI